MYRHRANRAHVVDSTTGCRRTGYRGTAGPTHHRLRGRGRRAVGDVEHDLRRGVLRGGRTRRQTRTAGDRTRVTHGRTHRHRQRQLAGRRRDDRRRKRDGLAGVDGRRDDRPRRHGDCPDRPDPGPKSGQGLAHYRRRATGRLELHGPPG